MLWSKISRILKRRLVYGIIAVVVMTYGFVSIARQYHVEKDPATSEDESVIREPRKPFRWHLLSNDDNGTDNLALSCRNSVQGKVLLADDRGYTCPRQDLLSTGCCNPELTGTKRFSCDSCHENHCCSVYEHCLSCCLSPEKKPLLENVMAKASGNFKRLYDSVADHFELCLVKCRTSSLVTDKIMSELAIKLRTSLPTTGSESSRQAVYSLLGYPFVSDHFPKAEYNKSFLSSLSVTDRRYAVTGAKMYLDENLNRIMEKLNYDKPLNRYSVETPLGSFLRDSRYVFEEGIGNHLREGKKMKIRVESRERSGRSVTLEEGESNIWDNRTDIVAQAMVDICKHEPQRVSGLLKAFRENHNPLPSPLRYLLIAKFLFGKEKLGFAKGASLSEIESMWQEKFIKTVHQNTANLNVERAIRSPIWREIDNAVIEVYGRVAVLRMYDSDLHQIEAARVLNILHVYNRTFDPLLVLWLFPLQLTLDYVVKGTDSHVMKLAILFELEVRHCIPTPAQIFAMAQEVVDTWRDWDKRLFDHVKSSLQKSVWLNTKDFPQQTVHVNASEANKIGVKMKGRSRGDVPDDCLAIFVDPAIFIRKWIAEGFAGILSRSALLYIWDQLFFNDWNPHTIRDVCLALLFLMKNRFSKTKNYFSVREVFLTDPSRLFTADIRKAYTHVQQEDSFEDIPAMNRSDNA